MKIRHSAALAAILLAGLVLGSAPALAQQPGSDDPPMCAGRPTDINGQSVIALNEGGAAIRAKMNVNIDGGAKAYHRDNAAGGALIHLCNAGQVHLPDGSRYYGSDSNAICTGKFMDDVKRIGDAGWNDPSVGAVRWFGILGLGDAVIAGRTVKGVKPVEQKDAPGFYVSPTSLEDQSFAVEDQRRYVNPMLVPGAVMPNRAALKALGVQMGGLGVAIDTRRPDAKPVPFIVNDYGPRIGEGTVALARLVAGREVKAEIARSERYVGVVDGSDVVWVFFGGDALAAPYSPERVNEAAAKAFQAWGGEGKLKACIDLTKPG